MRVLHGHLLSRGTQDICGCGLPVPQPELVDLGDHSTVVYEPSMQTITEEFQGSDLELPCLEGSDTDVLYAVEHCLAPLRVGVDLAIARYVLAQLLKLCLELRLTLGSHIPLDGCNALLDSAKLLVYFGHVRLPHHDGGAL